MSQQQQKDMNAGVLALCHLVPPRPPGPEPCPSPALTLSQHLPQAEGASVHHDVLQLLLELAADAQAAHCGTEGQQLSSRPTRWVSPSTTGEINPRTRELHSSPAVGLLGRVADRQLQVVAAERVPGGTQTDLAGLRVPRGRNPLPGAPEETRAPQSFSFPSDWTAAIAHRVRANTLGKQG